MKELPKIMTIGEIGDPAMSITDQAKADKYFEALVQRAMKYFGQTRKQAEGITRSNLGYYAGYYDHETRLQVERLFNCAHPIFGKAITYKPTLEEAFNSGVEYMRGKMEKLCRD